MNDALPPVKQVVKYRSKKKQHTALTKALENKIEPTKVVKTQTPVVTKRGAKPNVVKNFIDDERSMDMAVYIGQGLSVEEAGLLAKFSPEELKQLNERSDSYRKFVELQLIKFKQKHLKVISSKDNPSTSQWMLEQKFPETFGKKANTTSGQVGSTQVIQAIVKSVQMDNDSLVVHDIENTEKKEKSINGEPSDSEGNQPSLESGGANILG